MLWKCENILRFYGEEFNNHAPRTNNSNTEIRVLECSLPTLVLAHSNSVDMINVEISIDYAEEEPLENCFDIISTYYVEPIFISLIATRPLRKHDLDENITSNKLYSSIKWS